jgi:hypothetical protein
VPEDHQEPFVGADFVPPSGLRTHDFVLEPLGPQHNDADYAAWTSSIPHGMQMIFLPGKDSPTLRRGVAAWLARDWPFRSIDASCGSAAE